MTLPSNCDDGIINFLCSRNILIFFLDQLSDNNECSSNGGLGPCEQICVNTLLGRQCLCRPGYTLKADGTTCKGGEYVKNHLFQANVQLTPGRTATQAHVSYYMCYRPTD